MLLSFLLHLGMNWAAMNELNMVLVSNMSKRNESANPHFLKANVTSSDSFFYKPQSLLKKLHLTMTDISTVGGVIYCWWNNVSVPDENSDIYCMSTCASCGKSYYTVCLVYIEFILYQVVCGQSSFTFPYHLDVELQ